MEKKIETESFPVEANELDALLAEKVNAVKGADGQAYLLSFHDDGVVWGKAKDGKLITSESLNDSRFPKFETETLQECRLFGKEGELLVWRVGENQFKGRTALESYLKDFEPIEENQVLWGTKTETDSDAAREFTIVADGSEGLRHAFPMNVVFKGEHRPLRLRVKHYVEYDEDGCAYISLSRLVNVEIQGEQK